MANASRWRVPAKHGVYVIAEVNRLHDIPLEMEVYYVGQSKDLKRRLVEHLDRYRGHNNDLTSALVAAKNPEFWFQTAQAGMLDAMERRYIADFEPRFNIIRYGGRHVA